MRQPEIHDRYHREVGVVLCERVLRARDHRLVAQLTTVGNDQAFGCRGKQPERVAQFAKLTALTLCEIRAPIVSANVLEDG